MAQRCILQVEDEEDDVLLLRHAFEKAGISNPIYVATDGEEAVAYLSGAGDFCNRRKFPLPSLILLDLKLPDKNGLEILKWLRAQPSLNTTVVVALTSSNHESDIRRAYEYGVNAYVVKPGDNQTRLEFANRLRGWWFGCCEFVPSVTVEN